MYQILYPWCIIQWITKIYKRANFLLYKHALILFKLIRSQVYTTEWNALNFNQILTSRQTKFLAIRANKRKVGLNALANRVFVLNNRIPLEWFNMSFETFKVHSKQEFILYYFCEMWFVNFILRLTAVEIAILIGQVVKMESSSTLDLLFPKGGYVIA